MEAIFDPKLTVESAICLMLSATNDIHSDYFQVPVTGQKENPIFRERVYCYELYYQMRRRWPENSCFRIMGELDKNKHPLIREKPLTNSKPDFTIHIPGELHNLLVIEVKNALFKHGRLEKPTDSQIRHDLQKLTAFRSLQHPYSAAIYLVYGLEVDASLKSFKEKCEQLETDKHNQCPIDLGKVMLYAHRKPRTVAERIELRSMRKESE